MNLALHDVEYRLGRFILTAVGLGLLLTTVMAMNGIYAGMVEDALSIVRAPKVDLWVVQKDTNGPFAESSRVPEDLYRNILTVSGVSEASPVAYQLLQIEHQEKILRLQVIGYRLGGLGGPPAIAAGRPILKNRYEMVVDRKAGVSLGTQFKFGRITLEVVGLTEGVVSNSGDSAAFITLEDAQELQFLKSNEAIRNDRARLQSDLSQNPQLSGVSADNLSSLLQSSHIANVILVRLEPWANAEEVAKNIARWTHYNVLTTQQQEDFLAKNVIERARQQILLFRIILLVVAAVIIALIIYTMTLEKTRDIATLKIIGAPNSKIVGLILQQSLILGFLGFVFGTIIISLTYEYFPRRLVLLVSDQIMVFGIVIGICIAASGIGIHKALSIDATTAMAG
ncbi:MAG TPA: ABC transporter permease [Pyrinomonadaceae bacterium]|nr:ABC transporter permease [Pyrinomonadaceae bacterium]HRK51312.1 ABC transporter permease [Pyrinomonadaceae bacterium]